MRLDPSKFLLFTLPEAEADSISQFTCGVPELDDFLRNEAPAFHDGRLGLTTCVYHPDFPGLAAYYTLANDSIPLNDSEFYDLGVNTATQPRSVPCVKIGKFAVHRDLQGHGNGKSIMDLIVGDILDSHGSSAARLVVLDSRPEQTGFYEKCRFVTSLHAARQAAHQGQGATFKMFLDVMADH